MQSWRETRAAITADRERFSAYFGPREPLYLQPGFVAAVLYRLTHYLFCHRWRRLAGLLHLVSRLLTAADLDPAASIGPGLVIPNPQAVIVRGTIGRDCTLMALASVGTPGPGDTAGPELGDQVVLESAALVVGAIRVGHRVRVGPRCLVTEDVPDGVEILPLGWRRVRL
jgi:serine O-acetyltransferase